MASPSAAGAEAALARAELVPGALSALAAGAELAILCPPKPAHCFVPNLDALSLPVHSAAASPTVHGAAAALARAELVPGALSVLAAGAGPAAVTPDGATIQLGAGGPAGHFEGLASRLLGLLASEPLLDAMFDGARVCMKEGRVLKMVCACWACRRQSRCWMPRLTVRGLSWGGVSNELQLLGLLALEMPLDAMFDAATFGQGWAQQGRSRMVTCIVSCSTVPLLWCQLRTDSSRRVRGHAHGAGCAGGALYAAVDICQLAMVWTAEPHLLSN